MVTTRAKKILGIAIMCGVSSVAGFAGALYYVSGQGVVLRERAQAVADHAIQQQTYESLASLLETTKAEREELNHYILTEDETIDFLAEIEALAAAEQVLITTDALTVVEKKDTSFNTLKVNLSLVGSPVAVQTVLQILETLPYMSYVNMLTIDQSMQNDAGVTAKVELMVTLAKL